MKYGKVLILGLVLLSAFKVVYASKVQINISENLKANAQYYQGEKSKAAIIIIHGFMLTHNFPTVTRLAESLNELGYTVLTPTLSLNINNRKQSLPCEAIHTHSLDQDIREIDLWAHWLKNRANEKIVLIGHSKGSLHVASYLQASPTVEIEQAIFLTLPDFGESSYSNETREHARIAHEMIKNNNTDLYEFGLSYCKKYPTTAEYFLSYYNLSKESIFKALAKIPINKALILGSEDGRIDKKWNLSLSFASAKIIVINGANHFFDYEYEFELLKEVEKLLSNLK